MKNWTTKDIYYAFRKSQSESKNRGFRMPKDFEKHLTTKMSQKNREALEISTKYFNTKWRNIDPFKFMTCGFEVLKSFTYTNFFDKRVLNLYIDRDKIEKREMEVNKSTIKNSAIFLKKYMKDKNISLNRYCMIRRDIHDSLPVSHYLKNKIDKFLFVWLIKVGYIKLTDEDRALVPYITTQYREILSKNEEMKNFLQKIQKILEVVNNE